MSPSSYFALPRELLEPAARARIDMFGQPFQALHPVASAPAGGAEDRERV